MLVLSFFFVCVFFSCVFFYSLMMDSDDIHPPEVKERAVKYNQPPWYNMNHTMINSYLSNTDSMAIMHGLMIINGGRHNMDKGDERKSSTSTCDNVNPTNYVPFMGFFEMNNGYYSLISKKPLSLWLVIIRALKPTPINRDQNDVLPKFNRFEKDIMEFINDRLEVYPKQILEETLNDMFAWLENLFWCFNYMPRLWFSEKMNIILGLLYLVQVLHRYICKSVWARGPNYSVDDVPFFVVSLIIEMGSMRMEMLKQPDQVVRDSPVWAEERTRYHESVMRDFKVSTSTIRKLEGCFANIY